MTNLTAATLPAPTRTSRGGYAKSVLRRRELVEGATALFAREGYRAATMLQIAAECGISRTGLLHHFPTKESLLQAVLIARDEAAHKIEVVADTKGSAVIRYFQGMVRVAEHNATIPEIINLYSVLSAESADPAHPAHTYFINRYYKSRDSYANVFRDARLEGILRADVKPNNAATETVALWDGIQIQWCLDKQSLDMADTMHRWFDEKLTVELPRAHPGPAGAEPF